MAVTVRAVHPSEFEQLYDLLWRSFERHYLRDARDYFSPFYEKDPFMDEELVRVVRADGGGLAASVTIFDRTVLIEGRPVRMGGIGNVATHPEHRGKGLAGLLLDDCVELMKKKGFGVSLLFAGPVPLYEKHGWMSLDAFSWDFSGLKPPAVERGLSVRPVSWSSERLEVYNLHKGFIQRHNFPTDRNMAYWNNYVWEFKDRHCDLIGVFRSDELLAYAIVDHDWKESSTWLKELCCTTGDAIPAVVDHLMKKYGTRRIRFSGSGRDNPVVVFLKSVAGETAEEPQKGFMARNINSDFDMGSARFCGKLLHFSGDDF